MERSCRMALSNWKEEKKGKKMRQRKTSGKTGMTRGVEKGNQLLIEDARRSGDINS